jgi:hypothetical protein
MDFSIEVLRADASTPMRTFTPNDEFYDPTATRPDAGSAAAEAGRRDGYACTRAVTAT